MEAHLKKLRLDVIGAVVSVKELGVNNKQVTCLFPPDMRHDLDDEEIVVEVVLFDKPERDTKVRARLAAVLGLALKRTYPNANVECLVNPFKPEQGYWSSQR